MNNTVQTNSILALVRAGATGRAWSVFAAEGLVDTSDDPSVLTLKGRLLKDRARATSETAERAWFFGEAADAYAAAAELAPASYPLINAATMALFAGDEARARSLADEVEAMISSGLDQSETPYWRDATRAEALLLLGRQSEAEQALDAAVTHAPQAWEDLATTLRQFRLISAHRAEDAQWLVRYAPPPSLHYSGLIGLAADDLDVAAKIGVALDELKPSFAYGALAAGADILIAEACLARGAELHLILPVQPSMFRAMSVEPYGAGWAERFDYLFERAISVNIAAPQQSLSHAAILLATDVAAGCAIENARRMESSAKSLRLVARDEAVLDGPDTYLISVERTDMSASDLPLADADLRIWLATDQGDGTPPSVERLPDMTSAVGRLTTPLTSALALDCQIAAVGEDDSEQKSRAARMAQAAAPGTVLASYEAAMSLLLINPKYQLEPLGELASNNGPVSIYSIRK